MSVTSCFGVVSRKAQYKDVYRSTIEILQHARIFKASCCLKVHNVPLNLASPISGSDEFDGSVTLAMKTFLMMTSL